MDPPASTNRIELFLIEFPIALFVVAMTQLLMVSLAMDPAQPLATRAVAIVELGLAALWTAYTVAVATGAIQGKH